VEAALSPLPPIPFQNPPPAKKIRMRSGKARGRDARYSARGGVQRVATRSERTLQSQVTTRAERAKSVEIFAKVGSSGVQEYNRDSNEFANVPINYVR